MTKEQRIEEMAKLVPNWMMIGVKEWTLISPNLSLPEQFERKKAIAEIFADAGYGNLREFAEKIKERFLKHYPTLFCDAVYQFSESDLDELLKEYLDN